MARAKSNGNKDSAATIGFEAGVSVRKDLAAEQAVPAPYSSKAEYSGARPEGLLGLIFQGAGLEIALDPAVRDFGRGHGGKGTAILFISNDSSLRHRLAWPSEALAARFSTEAEALYSRYSTNAAHSRTLATLRDTLLPKLLSGELRVNELDAALP